MKVGDLFRLNQSIAGVGTFYFENASLRRFPLDKEIVIPSGTRLILVALPEDEAGIEIEQDDPWTEHFLSWVEAQQPAVNLAFVSLDLTVARKDLEEHAQHIGHRPMEDHDRLEPI